MTHIADLLRTYKDEFAFVNTNTLREAADEIDDLTLALGRANNEIHQLKDLLGKANALARIRRARIMELMEEDLR